MTDNVNEKFKLALIKLKQKNYQEAIKLFDEIIITTAPVSSVVTLETYSISEWEYIDDITLIERDIGTKEASFDGHLALSLLFKIAQNNERRNEYIQKALKLNSNNFRIWREYGETTFQLGNIRQALLQFQEATNLNFNDSLCQEGIGLCYYYLDEPIKAISPLRKALSLDQKNHCIMNHLSFILSEIGELDEAHDLILQALQLDEANNIYLDTYACILFLQERYDESLKIFEKILGNKPKDWEISWDILTNLYETLGLRVKAKQLEEKLNL
ncbi:MAG TPA: tetratricopeptide repeat protein [Candidatus Bathyarchaeia archaeon]|nr:tetratricopeptide repeat protein [Candidatus Bathyarchaeia archaeon]